MNDKGFTLIEIIMIIVIIGILAVVVSPKLPDVGTTNANVFSDKLRADMRYAQNVAMTTNLRSRVYFNGTGTAPGEGYAVVSSTTSACSSFSTVTDPSGEGNLSVAVNTGSYAGITLTPSMACLEYDSFGQPYDCGGGSPGCSAIESGMTVAVNSNAAAAATITVSDQTGAVN